MVAAPSIPEYLMVCETRLGSNGQHLWRFSLETLSGESVADASDHEPCDLNRLALLAVVRGLESLDGPSGVTLMCNNRHVIHGLRSGLPNWRENGFRWDYFGRLVAIPNQDLWCRVDRALDIHLVNTCWFSASVALPRSARPGGNLSSPAPLDRVRKWLANQVSNESHNLSFA